MSHQTPSISPPASTDALTTDAKRWSGVLARYSQPDPRRSVLELIATAAPFALSWLGALLMVYHGAALGLLLTLPAALFLVRLFMIQHDCGHGSFFRQRRSNDAVGRVLGVLTLTPYDYWRRTHAVHHATTGNLDRRGTGDVTLLTVGEYRALSRARRLVYRLIRNPAVLIGLGPIFLFVLKYRLPVGLMSRGIAPWISAMTTNLAIATLATLVIVQVGFTKFLMVQIPVTLLSGAIGVWLFYVQHQFEHVYWARDTEWSFHLGALRGSTHLELPGVLRWLTANIGVHHVHHLASRIPSYRLPETLRNHPELRSVSRLSLRESLRCFRFALCDEARGRLVGFRDLDRRSVY